jgi:TonB family protein
MSGTADIGMGNAPSHLSRPIWMFAGAAALAIHVGCVTLALSSVRSDDPDQDLGAPAIEIGVALMSPQREPTELAVGPDTDASAAAPEEVEQKKVVETTNLPKAIPKQTDDPDRVVSPDDNKKITKEEPKTASVQADPSQASVASEATAMPSIESAPPAPRSVAPSPGVGESAARARITWEKELAAHFNKYKRYPDSRAMANAQVVVSFVLDRRGHVLSTHIVQGSGDAAFDNAAIAMLHRSDPVPPPPPLVADDGLTFTLPVIFQAKERHRAAAAAR